MTQGVLQNALLHVYLRWRDDEVQSVGRLGYVNRVAYFEYDREFQSSGLEISPIRHRTPGETVTIPPYDNAVFEGLHGVFHDSLPDSWGRLLVDRRARELGIEPATLTPLDRLAWVGDRGVGALCYEPTIDVWGEDSSALDLNRLAGDAREVLEGKASEVIAELGQIGGSPGGARPKAMVAINEADGAIYGPTKVEDNFQHCLVKFRGIDDPEDAANIEKAYAEMAQAAGVNVPVTRLISGADRLSYFVSQRFDRVGTERLHVHSASGILYADFRLPSLDYRDLIALTRAITRDHREVVAMFTVAVFNVLAHNRDDHARQFTYLMKRSGEWQLAPAYDLTFSPGPGGEHATSVLGRGRQIDHEHLIQLGKSADLTSSQSQEIIDQVASAVSRWDDYARAYDVGNQSRSRIGAALA